MSSDEMTEVQRHLARLEERIGRQEKRHVLLVAILTLALVLVFLWIILHL